jgi:hypothetical protein
MALHHHLVDVEATSDVVQRQYICNMLRNPYENDERVSVSSDLQMVSLSL